MAHRPKEHPALKAVRDCGTGKVKVAASDIDGILRGKYLHTNKFLGAAEPHPNGGFGFCDVVFGWDANDHCHDNAALTGWQHGFPDALARLDLDTYRTVPWDDGVPFFLDDFVTPAGAPSPICPRQTLKRVLARAAKLGVLPMTGMEFEWFNFAETPQSWAAKKGRRPRADHAGHVRLLALAHEPQARVFQGADGRDAAVRRADRRAAHRDRAGRV